MEINAALTLEASNVCKSQLWRLVTVKLSSSPLFSVITVQSHSCHEW
jgi:hypothetical protein